MNARILLWPLLIVVGALSGCGNPSTSAAKAEVRIEVVKFDQLQKALKAQQGHVVVMDVWATWCGPCKQEFPHLVALHERHAKDGVVCMSVSLDDPKERDTALAFLKSKGATFPNYLLDEGEKGFDRSMLDLQSIPAVFVYDRDGKLARKFTNDDPDNPFTYADVEKLAKQLQARK